MANLNWGIIGTSSVAEQFIAALNVTSGNIALAVSSKNSANAKSFASRWGIPKSYEDYESLLEDKDIDAVYIATPNSLHFDQALLGLESGKHVLLEKPFTLTTEQAKTLVQKAKEQGLLCMEAMWTKVQPCINEVKSLIDAGDLGQIIGFSGGIGLPHQFSKDSRLFRADLGGGSLYDLGIYPLTLIQYFSGCDWRPISTRSKLSATGVDLHLCTQLLSEKGQNAQVTSSLICSIEDNFFIYGSKASLQLIGPVYRPTGYKIDYYEEYDETRTDAQSVARRSSVKSKLLRYFPLVMTLQNRFQRLINRYWNKPHYVSYNLNGYQYQIEEFHRQVMLGSSESTIVSSKDTISVIALIESIHNQSYEEI